MASALDGLRVVDLSTTLPGAQVAQFLADYGADVVGVEPPGGSPLRRQPAWPFWARGKKSVVLDLHDATQLATAARLAGGADVVIETFRPGTAERLGLDHATLGRGNPALVLCSITGFGRVGPLAAIKGYEALVMAKLGGLELFAPMVERAGPAHVSVPFCSYSAAQTAIQGILAALYEREGSGLGQQVDASLAQGVTALDPWNWFTELLTMRYPEAFAGAAAFEDGIPTGPFPFLLLIALSADGQWLQFSQVQPRLFQAFMAALGLTWMFSDPAWAGLPVFEDAERRVAFWDVLLTESRKKTLAEWWEVFDADANVWAEVFRRDAELLDHPQLRHLDFVVESHDPAYGIVRQPGPLVRCDATPGLAPRPSPELDADRAEAAGADQTEAQAPDAQGPQEIPATPTPESGELPLAGVTILELGGFYAAPYGATLLTDLGARVIKLEPLEGDPMRTILPYPESGGAKVLQGKESVAVDIATEAGRQIVYQLAGRSDLVLQCYRAGVAERNGVDAATLRAINPNLVYLNAPGYGVDGPCGHRPAFAPTIGAGSGVAMRNLGAAAPPSSPAVTQAEVKRWAPRLQAAGGGVSIQSDGVAALGVATGLLLGLLARARGHGGQTMMTTMLSTVSHALSETMVTYPGRGAPPTADPDLYGLTARYRLYQTSRGWVFLAAPQEREWPALTRVLSPDGALLADRRFATEAARASADPALSQALGALFATRPAADWERELLAVDIGCVAVAEQLLERVLLSDDLGRASGYVADVHHPTFDDHPRLAPLVRFSRSATVARPACLLGQHTDAVLGELGYDPAGIEGLRRAGVIG